MSDFSQRFSKGVRNDWETPDDLFNKLNDEFGFTLDVCANETNKKCEVFFSESDDAFTKDWNGVCWMNPPFKNTKKWVIKALGEAQKGATVVCLIPAITNTHWWHDYAMKGEVRFVLGRPIFKGAKEGLPNPLAIVVFTPSNTARTRQGQAAPQFEVFE